MGTESFKPDQQAVLDLVGDIYESTIRPEHWDRVLENICRLTRARSAGIYVRDKKTKTSRALCQYGLPDYARSLYNSGIGRFDPGYEMMESLSSGDSFQLFNIRDKRSKQSTFYHLAIRPMGTHHVSAVCIFNNDENVCGIGVHRGKDEVPFEPHCLTLLSQLVPHFERAIRIQQEFERLRKKASVLEAGYAKLSLGIVVVDEYARPSYMNPMAERLVKDHPALGVGPDRALRAHRHEQSNQLKQHVQLCVEGKPLYASLGLRHPDAEHPLVAMVVPATEEVWETGAEERKAIIYLNDPAEDKVCFSPEALMESYSLTHAEAKVALCLLNGMTIEQVADQQDRSINTIRTQMKKVYEKTGVNRQADLVRLLMGASLPLR